MTFSQMTVNDIYTESKLTRKDILMNVNRHGASFSALSSVISGVTSSFNTQFDLEQVSFPLLLRSFPVDQKLPLLHNENSRLHHFYQSIILITCSFFSTFK